MISTSLGGRGLHIRLACRRSDMWPFSCGDRLDLRGSEKRCPVNCIVAHGAVNQINRKQALAAVPDFVAECFPPAPGVRFFADAGGGLRCLDALGVDRLGFLGEPCAVQTLGKAALALAVEPPCSQHDVSQIVLHLSILLFRFGKGPVRDCVVVG